MTPAQLQDWKHHSENYREGIDYMKDRRDGKQTSVKTPWLQVNEAGMDGLEWNTINVVAGRPASGKTLVVNQITRESFDLNPNQDFCILDCQWEMLGRTQAIREFSAVLNKSVRVLNSASGERLSDEDLQAAIDYANSRQHLPIWTIERPRTVENFQRVVERFINWRNGQKTIVTIDHSILFRKHYTEKDKIETLYNLGEALNHMKKTLPVMFIVLSQLNRNVEQKERLTNGSNLNYLLDSDIFGGDALLMYTDILLMINRPAKYNIERYGPEEFECDPNTLAFHFNKVRNGDPRLVFMQAEFDKMKIHDYPVNSYGKRFPPSKKQPKQVIPTNGSGKPLLSTRQLP